MHMLLQGHGDAVNGLAWSADGRLLATACDDMTLRVYDAAELRPQKQAGGPGATLRFRAVRTRSAPLAVSFGDDGASLVAALRGADLLQVLLHCSFLGPRHIQYGVTGTAANVPTTRTCHSVTPAVYIWLSHAPSTPPRLHDVSRWLSPVLVHQTHET
jgi:WD40 repeat protein